MRARKRISTGLFWRITLFPWLCRILSLRWANVLSCYRASIVTSSLSAFLCSILGDCTGRKPVSYVALLHMLIRTLYCATSPACACAKNLYVEDCITTAMV